MNKRFNFQVPIMEVGKSTDETKDFIIAGTAINATTTSNNHKFLKEELEASAQTLTGVPLLKDHNNTIDSIMGRVKEGKYTGDKVEFSAIVIDKNAQEMIKDGRLNSISVGADVESFEEDVDDNTFVPRGIKFRELSFVAVGADEGATFGMALSEAYKLNKENVNMTENVDKPEMVTKETMEAAIAKGITEALAKDAEARKLVEAKAEEEAKEAKVKEEADAKIAKEAEETEEAKKAEEAKEAEKIKAAKEAEEAEKIKAAKEAEEDAEEAASTPYKIEQGNGSLSGGSFSVVRG